MLSKLENENKPVLLPIAMFHSRPNRLKQRNVYESDSCSRVDAKDGKRLLRNFQPIGGGVYAFENRFWEKVDIFVLEKVKVPAFKASTIGLKHASKIAP
jgi:hypothetical protein